MGVDVPLFIPGVYVINQSTRADTCIYMIKYLSGLIHLYGSKKKKKKKKIGVSLQEDQF